MTSINPMIPDDEFSSGCSLVVGNLIRAAALRERQMCAELARTAYEAWQSDPDCQVDSDIRACEDIAKRIEARQ